MVVMKFKKYLLLLVILVVVGCSKGPADPYKTYRQYTAEELFTRAEATLSKRHYAEAVKKYEALNALFPFGPYAEQAEVDLIYAYYKNSDYPSAVAETDRYIRLYPRGQYIDYAYYMKGVVSFEEGIPWVERKMGVDPALRDLSNKKEAFLAFEQLATLFPESHYTPDALLRMDYIRNLIARKDVIIGEYYLERKAYVAAVNRASSVVEHFEGSPEVIPALAVMVEGYRALGLYHLADEMLQVFELSYPDAPQLKKLLAKKHVA